MAFVLEVCHPNKISGSYLATQSSRRAPVTVHISKLNCKTACFEFTVFTKTRITYIHLYSAFSRLAPPTHTEVIRSVSARTAF